MAEAEARARWRDLRDNFDRTYTASKDSMGAVIRLSASFGNLPEPDREAATEELIEWLHSDDESLRYDACFIIQEHRLRVAAPALRALAERLEYMDGPGAPYEWGKVNRLLAGLAPEE